MKVKFRTLIVKAFAAAVAAVALSSVACAQSAEEATKADLQHVADMLVGITYMSNSVDGNVGSIREAAHVASMAGDTAREARAANHEKAYRGFGLIVTALVAEQKGHNLAAPEIKALGCRMLNDVTREEWLTPIVEKVKKERCDNTFDESERSVATKEEMVSVATLLLVDADSFHRQESPAMAVGNAIAARDILDAISAGDTVIAGAFGLIFAYETSSLMRLAEVFNEEKVNMLAAGKIRALACLMSTEADPEFAPMLEKVRAACFI